jgi:hypothetical protein
VEELELYNSQDENGELGDEETIRIKFRLLGPLGQGTISLSISVDH